MTEYPYSTADIAAKMGGASAKTIRKRARALGLGIDLQGRAGYRYSDDDLERLIDSMRPAGADAPKRRRRRAA